jgi:hypothetical protein
MEEKQYIIPESMVKGLLDYLMERPYKEVVGGVQGLMSLQELEQPEEVFEEEKWS